MDHPSRYPIWSLLRRARKEAGLSQRQLAGLAGTSQAAIARYEKARVMPDLATLFRLLRACGFDLRMDLQPHDDSNEVLIAENLRRTAAERAARNRSATRMRAAAARPRSSEAAARSRASEAAARSRASEAAARSRVSGGAVTDA